MLFLVVVQIKDVPDIEFTGYLACLFRLATAQDNDSLRMRGLFPAATAHAWSQLSQISGRISGSTGYPAKHKKWPDNRHIPSADDLSEKGFGFRIQIWICIFRIRIPHTG